MLICDSKMDRALICDGDPQELTRLASVLTRLGFVVEAYPDGGSALKQFINSSPDIVIWDCFAPTVNGIRMFETLKSDAESSRIPYILMCYRDMKDVAEASGCVCILVKPFSDIELLDMVRDASSSQ